MLDALAERSRWDVACGEPNDQAATVYFCLHLYALAAQSLGEELGEGDRISLLSLPFERL
ncbi:MAG: hypothetical protein AAFR26_08685 [Cyanobacteria bacterium J06626_4]